MDIQWKHKSFDIEDRDRVLSLREKIFSEPSYDVKRWEWQYKNNPMGPSFIDLAVDQKDESLLAGHYAVISYRFSFGAEKKYGVQSLDTFTSPDYQRQGIFVSLAEKTYEKSFDNDVDFIFGFPNKNSYPGFVKKLNFKDPFGFKLFKLPLKLGYYSNKVPGGGLFSRIPINFSSDVSDFEFKKVDAFPSDYSDLLSGYLSTIDYQIIRNSEYMQWRYLECPDRHYDIFELRKNGLLKGVIIGRAEGDFVHLVDIIPLDEKSITVLIKKFINHYKKESTLCLTCFLNEDNVLEEFLRTAGFSSTDKSDDFRFIFRMNDKEIVDSKMDESKRWFLLGGDTDFY